MKHIFLSLTLITFFACGNTDKNEKVKTETPQQNTDIKEEKFTIKMSNSSAEEDSIPQNGEYIKRYKNGNVEMQGMMKNGKRDGLWKSFYDDGTPWSKTTFKDGIKNGPTTTWYENGKIRYEGSYENDSEKGVWKYYDEKGNFIKTFDYDKQ